MKKRIYRKIFRKILGLCCSCFYKSWFIQYLNKMKKDKQQIRKLSCSLNKSLNLFKHKKCEKILS